MPEIRIPDEYRRGFAEIRQLTEQQAEELISALEAEPPTLEREKLRSAVASNVSSLARSDIDRIIDTLVSLYALKGSMNLETLEFVDTVRRAMDESGREELEFDEDKERELFKDHLTQLLKVDSLGIATRANDLLYEDKHAVRGSTRVITDIRPVFRADPDEDPAAALIVHTLKVSYHDGGRIEDFLVTLDSEQIDELLRVLERAKSKAGSLKRTLEGAKIPFIDGE